MENKPTNQSAQEVDVLKLAEIEYPENENENDEEKIATENLRIGFQAGYQVALKSKSGGHMEDRIIKIDFCGHLNGEIIVKDNCIIIKNVTNAFVYIVNENEINIQSLASTPLQAKEMEVEKDVVKSVCAECKQEKEIYHK